MIKLVSMLMIIGIGITPTGTYAQSSKLFQSGEKNLSFYPNPFQNTMTLEVKNLPADNKTVKVEIYNIIGKLFYKNEFKFQNTEAKFNIDLENLQPGVYFMYIINSDKKVFKIIKEGQPTSSSSKDSSPIKNWVSLNENA